IRRESPATAACPPHDPSATPRTAQPPRADRFPALPRERPPRRMLPAVNFSKRNMSVKSDRWIRRMAAEGMIEPFEAGQVRTAADGHKIVSYGTSSYGYDVRVAREFKIFTNINSTIVDPKNFDADSFVDFT